MVVVVVVLVVGWGYNPRTSWAQEKVTADYNGGGKMAEEARRGKHIITMCFFLSFPSVILVHPITMEMGM